MQWILQDFEDTHKLADALDHLGIAYSWHKVVPFVGDLIPKPVVSNPRSVVMFGSYGLWKYAAQNEYWPGVFKIKPFVQEAAWHDFLLNGADALFITLCDIPARLEDGGREWFLRPIDDSKEVAGSVKSADEIIRLAEKVLALDEEEIPLGSLRHDTQMMLTQPVRILQEWRLWVVEGKVVTYSLYKDGSRVVYRHEIDEDALTFGQKMVDVNPDYSPAYVIDICRTKVGLKMIETNCLNAAGLYAADIVKLARAIDGTSGG